MRVVSNPVSFLSLVLFLTAGAPAASAQTASAPYADNNDLSRAMTRYYERPFDLPHFLAEWERLGGTGRDQTMGFLAGLFAKHPDRARTATAATNLGRQGQAVVIQGLRLAGKHPEAVGAAKQWGWPPEQIAPITPVIPLRSLKAEGAAAPAAFDLFWAASFATGDAAYVRPIYDYYAAAAAQPDIDLGDMVAVVAAQHRRDRQVMEALGKKYPRDTLLRLVYAASALWSLESNGRQHTFVAAALDRYAKEQPGTNAAKGLKDLRAALAGR